jgi:hypothetical protein
MTLKTINGVVMAALDPCLVTISFNKKYIEIKGRVREMAEAHTKLDSSKYTFSLGLGSLPNDN